MKNDKINIIIRYANINDHLWLAEHDEHISEMSLKNKINNNEVYVIEINGKIVGWLRYNLFWDNIPYMNMVYILDEYQKMGIGKSLVQY